ncbi:hypothetical protein IV454_26715 [Massilia antarctica]|uniref:Uncharacterized protein n=1 Tax=Massilia antarctica TaxID=2765360 RepID=A0AA48WCH8_9BURK|nr:hypothetical protein [Massilia antarctica]QPI49034.1 hypothetical protein IV454_26715 [Massilia antarctica]
MRRRQPLRHIQELRAGSKALSAPQKNIVIEQLFSLSLSSSAACAAERGPASHALHEWLPHENAFHKVKKELTHAE